MKSILLSRYVFALVILFFLTQCRKVAPQPPRAEGFDAALTAEKSSVAGSIIFPIKALEDKINQKLDTVLVGKKIPGTLFPFRVARSGRVRVRYANQQVQLSTPLQLWVARPFSTDKAPPERPFCSLSINFQSPLNVTPDWRLDSQIKFTDYEWIEKPEIRLLGLEISLTNLVTKLLEHFQTTIESTIDKSIHNELRLDRIVEPVWRDLHKPLLITKEYGLWLVPKPLAVESGPISGNASAIITHLRILFDTRTELQFNKPAYSATALPALTKREQVPQESVLRVMSSIPYADVNQVLQSTIARKPPKLVWGSLTLKGVSVYGAQRSLIVKADVSGLLDGTVYLRGRPAFDTLTNKLMIQNLDFDADTDAALPELAGSLVHKGLVEVLEEMLVISMGDDIKQLPDKITKAFGKGGAGKKASLKIHSFRFVPQHLAVRPEGVQALIKVESKLAVQMKKL